MKFQSLFFTTASFLMLSLALPTLANSKMTYVVRQTTGHDDNPGTSRKPFKTITKALAMIKPGDTVYVGEGRYGDFTIAKNNVHFESPNKNAIIDAGGDQEYAVRIIGNHVTLKGFEITGSTGGGVQVRDTHHIDLLENYTHHNKGPGIYTWRSDHLRVIGNESAYNGGEKAAAGISIHSPKNHGPKNPRYNIEVVGNYLHHNVMTAKGTEGWGLILDGVERGIPGGYKTWLTGYNGYTLIEDNLSNYNGKGGILSHYAKNADFVRNATRLNATDAWIGNGFEMGIRASQNIDLYDNNFIGGGGGPAPADYVVYIWEGSSGRSQGNYTLEMNDPSNKGFLVDSSSARSFSAFPSMNYYGSFISWTKPNYWPFK